MPHDIKASNAFVINLAYYRKKDWYRFIKIIDDRFSKHDTWHEWHKDFQKTKRNLINHGFLPLRASAKPSADLCEKPKPQSID